MTARKRLFKGTRLSMLLLFLLVSMVVSAAANDKTTIRFAMWGTDQEVKIYQQIIDKFEADNPDIAVEFEYASWGEYWTRLQLQILGGVAPDVVRMSGSYLEQFAREGMLYNIQPLIDRDEFPLQDYFDTSGIFAVDGNYYGLPEGGDIIALYYNADLFDAAGLSYPTADWTWDDLREAARKLTIRQDGEVVQWGLFTQFYGDGLRGYINFVLQAGGRALNDEKTKSRVNEPEFIEAIEFLRTLVREDGVAKLDGDEIAMFASGQTAMLTAVVPFWTVFFQDAPFDWDVAPLPMGKQRAAAMNFLGFSMTAATTQTEAAWRLLKYMSGPEGQEVIARNRQMLPSLRSAALSPEFIDAGTRPFRLREVIEATGSHLYDLQFTNRFDDWTGALAAEIRAVMLGEKPVEIAMTQAAERIDALLASD